MNKNERRELFERVYGDLKTLASRKLANERSGHTLQPTALVHEVFLKLNAIENFKNTAHFYASAAQAMQRILVDHARSKLAQKRGGAAKQALLMDVAKVVEDPVELIIIDELLSKLECRSPRKAEMVRLRVFAGCTLEESAKVLGISTSTADDDWAFVRAWLRREWQIGKHFEE